MGGVCLPRGGYSLQPARRSHRPLNRYGETAKAGRIVGVCTTTGKWLISRRLNWHPVRGAEGREEAEAKARVLRGETPQDETARAAKAAPWTGFNNCTARITRELVRELVPPSPHFKEDWCKPEMVAQFRALRAMQATEAWH